MAEKRQHENGPPVYSAEEARGAEIILRTRRRRLVFFGALAVLALLAIFGWVL